MRIIRGNSLGEMAMRRRGGNGTERRLAAGLWALAALAAVAAVGLTALPAGATLPIGADGATIAPMLERVTPAVVNISVRSHTSVHNPLLQDPFFRQFFNVPDVPERREQMSAGSGVIIDAAAGLVVTNNHVVRDADQIMVTLKDRRRLQATLVGTDAGTDLALLRIKAGSLTALPIGDSDTVRVGDFVAAIGNPFGLGQTVTSGIVSALGRSGLEIEGYEDFIQTDASINPGNSGGALVNFAGQLIGLNTAIIGPSGGNVGIGFAVPSNMVRAVLRQLADYGEVRRGRLGIEVQDLTPELADSFDETVTKAVSEGALISKVVPGSAAAQAGLKTGDVVVGLNGSPVRGATDLRNRIGLMTVGTDVSLDVLRRGEHVTVSARIGH
jgi:serine protease DegQ